MSQRKPKTGSLLREFNPLDGWDRELEIVKADYVELRRTWIPVVKTGVTSLVDTVGDWLFYVHAKEEFVDIGWYEQALLCCCVISLILGACAVLGTFFDSVVKNWTPSNQNRVKGWKKWIRRVSMTEIFVEDIPQVYLTSKVMKMFNGGTYTTEAVFNTTTSFLNLTIGFLDLWMPPPKSTNEQMGAQKEEIKENEDAAEESRIT